MHLLIEERKKVWVRKGCTIMSKGWTDRRGQTLIKFLVALAKSIVFLKSVDASNKIKTRRTWFTLLKDAILKIGPQNVVQIVTNNTTTYVPAEKLLEEKFPPIFSTPCIAYCIDLILEDIGKISWVKQVVDNVQTKIHHKGHLQSFLGSQLDEVV